MTPNVDPLFALSRAGFHACAGEVDHLFYYLLGVSVFFTALIFVSDRLLWRFATAGNPMTEFPRVNVQSTMLEITWSIVPLVFMLVMFFWGAMLYAKMKRPPENADADQCHRQAMDVESCSIRKELREINELHVPIGQPIKLMMGSQDVIHSFFIPGVSDQAGCCSWQLFKRNGLSRPSPGRYHIFCTPILRDGAFEDDRARWW